MLTYNKYLAELGVKKSDYPFKTIHERRAYLNKHRQLMIHTWNMNWTLTLEIYTYLRAFKEGIGQFPCYPGCFDQFEEWASVVDEMIDGFESYIKWQIKDDKFEATTEEYDEMKPKLEKACKLLGEWLPALWW
ncbi:hypothetical protein [Megamonas hypermegale]|uniref:hypothetical protein n=1 Tax=Megamonas hypermegale TaxID=158847 RepID=UPI0026EB4688|nr:hypothetical protein [Megamonas hypermegale]